MDNQITEQQAIEFLRNRCLELAAKTGEDFLSIKLEVYNPSVQGNRASKYWTVYINDAGNNENDSLPEAEAAAIAKLPPFSAEGKKAKAAILRNEAQIALTAAERLEQEAAQ